MGTPGYTYTKRAAPVGETVTVSNQEGAVVARLLVDNQGASCTCDWPASEGKCLHLLLMEREEGRLLAKDWPVGRRGKLWPWHTA